jgi:hypothetical protein
MYRCILWTEFINFNIKPGRSVHEISTEFKVCLIENIRSVWKQLKLSEKNSSYLMVLLLPRFHTAFAITEVFTIPWKELSYSLLLATAALRYQLSNRSWFRPKIKFKFVAAKILLHSWNQMMKMQGTLLGLCTGCSVVLVTKVQTV